MTTFKVIIVDDEVASRYLIKNALSKHYGSKVEIIAEAEGVRQGVEVIKNETFDILFLDINMPDGSGFDLLSKVDYTLFEIVFVTAYDQYAIKAFEYSAAGYLVKPFKSSDLIKAIDRIVQQTKRVTNKLPYKILLENQESMVIKKLVVPNAEGFAVLNIKDILYVESERNYSIFYLVGGTKMISSKTLSVYDHQLTDLGFYRVHHSYLIQLNKVKAYLKGDGGMVKMENDALIPISRQKKAEFGEKFLR